jgi:hypothetical protein
MLLPILFTAIVAPKPLLMAHYMPWHQAPPVSQEWGWHWTMNHFVPTKTLNGRREIASHYYPLIGPYDNTDLKVLEYHVQLMKLAGIDGAILDWYGIDDVYDYAFVHRATQMFIQVLKRANMKFAICYEDQTLPPLIKFGKTPQEDSAVYGRKVMQWMDQNWFKARHYLRIDNKPVLMVFGPQFFKPEQWGAITKGIDVEVYGVMGDHGFANGGFAWPAPKESPEKSQAEMDDFYARAKGKRFIAGAYPRFNDIYKEAGLSYSHPKIPDDKGATFKHTLAQAIESGSPVVQIATWNDWGEGTVIEPSCEFGMRDLEMIQRTRADLLKEKPRFGKGDLQLPLRLLRLRKARGSKKELDRLSALLISGRTKDVDQALRKIEPK